MKNEINIIWSESWIKNDLACLNKILQEAIDDFVDDADVIVNIEAKTGDNGLSMFWIYTMKKK